MWYTVLKSSWKQCYLLTVRYWFNMLSGVITLFIIFLMLFMGTKAVGAGAFNLGETLEGLFTGYVVWMVVMMGFQDLAWGVTNEAQTGTLEQLYLSPMGYKWIGVFMQSCNMLLNLVFMAVMVALMALLTGQSIHLDGVSLVPLFVATYLQANGLGFALAGLALIYKRIAAFFQVVQFAVIGLLVIPWNKFPWAKYLPFSMGRHLLQRVMIDGVRLWQLPLSQIAILLLVTVISLGLGLALFALAETKAKTKGLLGQY
ncbi:MAG TPA: hypothetical protein GX510_01185 [Firmicutes bacterium]|nr:hypothetical protein [Candidatus Fermentithermobacillaceae bacterium]